MIWWNWLILAIGAWLTTDALFALVIGWRAKQR